MFWKIRLGSPTLTRPVTSVLIVTIALGVDGANQDTNGYFGEPPNEPIQLQLGPNPQASMNQQFE